jgi:predicted nucleic acid-binding protein
VTRVFADTLYWIAVVMRDDPWHGRALAARAAYSDAAIVTTDDVLVEFLNAVSARGFHCREQAALMAHDMLADPAVTVIPQSHASLLTGIGLYMARADKSYSLTDCISMNVMRSEGISEILINDRHFAQEGFNVLIQR